MPFATTAISNMMAERRSEYVSCVKALADHLGKPASVLVRQG